MFASGKAADTNLPPILLGGENSITLVNPTTTPYTLTFDSSNSDNIGVGDLIIVSAIGGDTGLSATTSDFTSLHTSSTDFGATILYAVFDGTSISVSFSPLYSNRENYIIQYAWFKNVDTSNPIDTSFSLQTAAGQNQTIDPASLTTVTKNAVVVSGVIFFDGNQAISGTLPQDALSTPSNLTAIDEVTTAWEPFSGATLDNVLHSRMTYATVPTAGSFDPASYGTPAADSSIRYKYWTLALKPANPEQEATNETVFQGATAISVDDVTGTGPGVPYTENSNTTYPITIDASTTFSNGKGIGLGDFVFVAVGGYSLYSVTTSDFTSLGTSGVIPEVEYYYAIFNGTPLTLNVNKFSSNSDQPFTYHYCSIRYPDTSSPIDVTLSTQTLSASDVDGQLVVDTDSLTTNTDGAFVLNGLFAYGLGESSPSTNPPNIASYLSTPSNMDGSVEVQDSTNQTNPFGDPFKIYNALANVKVDTAGSFDPATWGTVPLATDQTIGVQAYTLAIKPA